MHDRYNDLYTQDCTKKEVGRSVKTKAQSENILDSS